MKFESPENNNVKEKAEAIISNIDPDLEVSISEVIVSQEGADDRKAVVLRFDHAQNQSMSWTMDIESSIEYLEHDLEKAIKKAYRDQAWKSGDPKLKKIAASLIE